MRLISLIFISFIITSFCYSQESKFDSVYRIYAKDLINIEVEEALKNVDYLITISKNDTEKNRALILKASFLMYYGLNEEAQIIFIKSEKLALKNKDYLSLTRIYGYISSIYRESALFSSSLKYLEKASKVSEQIKDHDTKWRFKGNVAQERANIEMEKENYRESIRYALLSIQYLSKINANSIQDINYHKVISNGLISKNYLSLNKIDSSLIYLEKAKVNMEDVNISFLPLEGSILNGFGEAYCVNKSYDKAEEYFLKAKKIADEANYFNLKKDVYEALSHLYKEMGESEKFINLNEQYNELIKQEENSRKLVADKLLNSLYKQQLEAKANKKRTSRIITLLVILSILLLSILAWYIRNKKQNQKKFKTYINDLNNKTIKNNIAIKESENSKNYISEEKEISILDSLTKLEESEFYLDHNISLTALSSKVGVNQRYLTYVIKKHLSTDFATYINELRINYIVNRIKSEPKFLTYKISYLAEQCGFSSHSRFSINFKKITGTTPSSFINYIRNEKREPQNG